MLLIFGMVGFGFACEDIKNPPTPPEKNCTNIVNTNSNTQSQTVNNNVSNINNNNNNAKSDSSSSSVSSAVNKNTISIKNNIVVIVSPKQYQNNHQAQNQGQIQGQGQAQGQMQQQKIVMPNKEVVKVECPIGYTPVMDTSGKIYYMPCNQNNQPSENATNSTIPMKNTGTPIGTLVMGTIFGGLGMIGAFKAGILGRFGV
jgi:hypothetical protein